MDVRVCRGDTSQFHKHETPSVFIVLQPVKTGSEIITEEAKAIALSRDATISFEGFYLKPRVHRVGNEDKTEFHVIDVKILSKYQHRVGSPIQHEELQLLYDEKPLCI